MALESPTPEQLLTEACIFWSIGLVLFLGRLWSRVIAGGSIKRLQTDDYLMMVTFLFYTALLVLIQISCRYQTNTYAADELAAILADPTNLSNRIFGSKVVVALEQCMLHTTWGVKCCLLILYAKMTQGLAPHKFVLAIAAYVAIGYVILQILFFGVYCRPFSGYWTIPAVNPDQCALYKDHSITIAVLNISSDALMLLIPVPLIAKARMKLKKKALLCGVFSLGIVTILAAILNKVYNFESPTTLVYMVWYQVEASTAMYVANLTCWWPLLRYLLGLSSFELSSGGKYRKNRGGKYAYGGNSGHLSQHPTTVKSNIVGGTLSSGRFNLFTNNKFSALGSQATEYAAKTQNGSQEAINKPAATRRGSTGSHSLADGNHQTNIPLEIWHKVDYQITEVTPSSSSSSGRNTPVVPHSEPTAPPTLHRSASQTLGKGGQNYQVAVSVPTTTRNNEGEKVRTSEERSLSSNEDRDLERGLP